MTTFKIGDQAILTCALSDRFSVDITDVITDPETKVVKYRVVQNGIFTNPSPPWSKHLFDPSDLKTCHLVPEKNWYGTVLRRRHVAEDDDTKRAIWQAKIQECDAAIAAAWSKYAHIKVGMRVRWLKTISSPDHNGALVEVQVPENMGTVKYIANNFHCYIDDTTGKNRVIQIWLLIVD